MPTESNKKKTAKVEKKVAKEEKKSLLSIKREPDELKTLEYYVDDRIELIKQIFSSLKSKTIESIIPEFLQGKPFEEIQEICLEEVLGISKKRLLSIINATKCPTDTESSDSGSDVEKIEEHISLEEISSDSNDELSKPRKKKKRELKKASVENSSKGESVAEVAGEQNGQNEKQYSVLELLELQARARAIRSQLALEPVTKIELDDSDNETPPKEQVKEPVVKSRTESVGSNSKHSDKDALMSSAQEQKTSTASKPVRLKRNFRQRQMEGYESDENHTVNDKDQINQNENRNENNKEQSDTKQTREKSIEKEKMPETIAEISVLHDDDVVPIVAEPEILCISSSDSENEEKKKPKKPKKSYITMPVIEKEVRPPTEDEIFLQKIKEKSEAKKKTEASKLKDDADRLYYTNNEDNNKESEPAMETKKVEKTDDIEMEDGEIIEDDEILEIPESPEPQPAEQKSDEKEKRLNERDTESRNTVQETDKRLNDSNSSDSESDNEGGKSGCESDISDSKERSLTSKKSTADDDDEDIIDLGKDEDLDFDQLEMNTTQNEMKMEQTPTRQTRSKAKEADKESPDEPKDESWDKRWLRGNKVSKVLATAKLANKVRSKIKEKKTKSVQKPAEDVESPKEAIPEIPPNIEVGSVEHYKELTKQK